MLLVVYSHEYVLLEMCEMREGNNTFLYRMD